MHRAIVIREKRSGPFSSSTPMTPPVMFAQGRFGQVPTVHMSVLSERSRRATLGGS